MARLTLRLSAAAKQCYIEAHQAWVQKNLPLLKECLERLAEAASDSVYLLRLRLYQAGYENKWVTACALAAELLQGLLETDEPHDEIWQKCTAEAWHLYGDYLYRLGADGAVEAFLAAAEQEPDIRQALQECSNAIFTANDREHSAAEWQALFARWRELLRRAVPEPFSPAPDYGHKKLRVGYLSADLHRHPVLNFVLPLLEKDFDSDAFEIFVYATGGEDELTAAIKADIPNWRALNGRTAEEVARAIRADEIDILVELGGHSANNRLAVLAYRPAPLQLLALGYMGSSGMHEVDYVVGDAVLDGVPEENERFFTEELLILPQTHFCYALLSPLPEVQPPPCLRNGYVTFGCMNNFAKVSDEALALWGEILRQAEGARLIIKHRIFDDEEGRAYTLERLERLGVDTERVELRGFTSDYLLTYHDIDIALDTFPYTGGLTTCETIAMGVPLVSRYGGRHGTRFSYSLLKNIGLEGLCTDTAEGYLALAVQLAQDKELLAALRTQLRPMLFNSPVCDRAGYRRQVAEAYRQIWQKREAGLRGENS